MPLYRATYTLNELSKLEIDTEAEGICIVIQPIGTGELILNYAIIDADTVDDAEEYAKELGEDIREQNLKDTAEN